MTHYEFHEYADIFPMLEGKELEALRADMDANGQINKIILYQGKILDGRNRYVNCKILDIEPETIEYTGDDPIGLVLSLNLHRRHLTERQRAMVAGRIANLSEGRPKNNSANLPSISQSEAAEQLKVSTRSVTDAVKVLKKGIPEVIAAVDSDKIAVSTAATLADKTPEQQREILAKCEQEGDGRLGKDGKLRPAKYKPRKKTVAKNNAPEEPEDYIDLPYNHNGEFIKFALPLDAAAMCNTISQRFKQESRAMRERIVKEVEGLAVIVKYLVHENYEDAND
jgi:ParB family chromosome partitioning protein